MAQIDKDKKNEEKNLLVWLDLEMTGLNIAKDRIIEIATLITDSELNTIAEGPGLVIHQSDELLLSMDRWNVKQHGRSGLTNQVRESVISETMAEEATLNFLQSHFSEAKIIPLCGNSVWTDRFYLKKYMPTLEAYFHYRNIDVSTIKELAKRWYGETIVKNFKKQSKHRALDDIYESIEELRYYRKLVFIAN